MTQDPYATPATKEPARPSSLKESDYIKAYAGFALAAFVVGTVVGSLVGMTLGSFLASSGTSLGFRYLFMLPSTLLAMFINYFVFRYFVGRFIVPKIAP